MNEILGFCVELPSKNVTGSKDSKCDESGIIHRLQEQRIVEQVQMAAVIW